MKFAWMCNFSNPFSWNEGHVRSRTCSTLLPWWITGTNSSYSGRAIREMDEWISRHTDLLMGRSQQTLTIKDINTFLPHQCFFNSDFWLGYNHKTICLCLNLRDSFSLIHKHVHGFAFQDRNNWKQGLAFYILYIGTCLFPEQTNEWIVCKSTKHV